MHPVVTRRDLLLGLGASTLACGPRPRGTQSPAADGTVALRPADAVFEQVIAGRVTVIDFWATWCEPCRDSIPKVIALSQAERARGLVVVGVHVGHGFEQALAFASEAGIDYALFADPEFRLSQHYGARNVPTVVVLDRDGRELLRGDEVDDAMRQAIAAALV